MKTISYRNTHIHRVSKILMLTLFLVFSDFITVKAAFNDVILKAMSDELNRNMENLVYKDFEKPFYIAYTVYDIEVERYSYSLGGRNMSVTDRGLSGGVRVMIGDYKLTDENYNDYTGRVNRDNEYMPMPIDPDYDGIRRYLWKATDNVYKSAAETYKNKVAAMKQQNMTEDDLPAPDFSKEKPREYIVKDNSWTSEDVSFEQLSKELSKVFLAYPDIIGSQVYMSNTKVYRYYINSEGTRLAVPESMITLSVTGAAYNRYNDLVSEDMSLESLSTANLPPADTLKSYIRTFADNLMERCGMENWDDTYSGPVLFENQAVCEVVFSDLFATGSGLVASRDQLVNNSYRGIYLENSNTLERRIGKKVISDLISVYDVPSLKSYNNIPLMGYYSIDNEGVAPKDTLPLVESGILKTLLTNRIPIKSIPYSTGHSRSAIGDGSISTTVGPSNVILKSNAPLSKSELRKKLIDMAVDEGLDYAIILRPAIAGSLNCPVNVFKVDVKTGKETRITGVNPGVSDFDIMKDIVATSNHNVVLNTSQIGGNGPYGGGSATSYIYPDAVLVEDYELNSINQMLMKQPPAIQNPLKEE
ncbi:metallopeptidase TldD-related protein [Saccharicrinis sp. FJH54]|uniref:metallopeptidase TldD-related protein n=1 Tax=Saccharicrinis sp. FJH54 TaxID=3344665 RepID=UPI0035D52A95